METKVMVIMIMIVDKGGGARRMSDDDADNCVGVDSWGVVEVKEMECWSTQLLILGMKVADFGW